MALAWSARTVLIDSTTSLDSACLLASFAEIMMHLRVTVSPVQIRTTIIFPVAFAQGRNRLNAERGSGYQTSPALMYQDCAKASTLTTVNASRATTCIDSKTGSVYL